MSPDTAAMLALPRQSFEAAGSHLASVLGDLGLMNVEYRSATSRAAPLTDHATLLTTPLSVVIFGATGDLVRKKIFLHCISSVSLAYCRAISTLWPGAARP